MNFQDANYQICDPVLESVVRWYRLERVWVVGEGDGFEVRCVHHISKTRVTKWDPNNNFLKLANNSWVYQSVRRTERHHMSELEKSCKYWAEDLNCFFQFLDCEIIVQVLGLKCGLTLTINYTVPLTNVFNKSPCALTRMCKLLKIS